MHVGSMIFEHVHKEEEDTTTVVLPEGLTWPNEDICFLAHF
jgi:hypothetical protein